MGSLPWRPLLLPSLRPTPTTTAMALAMVTLATVSVTTAMARGVLMPALLPLRRGWLRQCLPLRLRSYPWLRPCCHPAVGGLYAGAGRYVANSAGVVHVAKRSADAEADPYYYGGYGYGLGY